MDQPVGHCSLADHPLPALLAAGVQLSLASDDPPLFGTTLVDKYLRCAEALGKFGDVLATAGNAVEQAFMPDELRSGSGPSKRRYPSRSFSCIDATRSAAAAATVHTVQEPPCFFTIALNSSIALTRSRGSSLRDRSTTSTRIATSATCSDTLSSPQWMQESGSRLFRSFSMVSKTARATTISRLDSCLHLSDRCSLLRSWRASASRSAR
ncbi:MAG: hypothetical protein HC927_09165 [Deltaproteobacteria bacterium]|nr:hypothetical protein [Deltaproteobacteria bacterium]